VRRGGFTGAGPVTCTSGSRAAAAFTLWPDGEVLLNAPEDLDVVDTTGAGDAFAGTLATAIIAGLPPVDAARLAVAAAACAVIGFGAQQSYPQPPVLYATARAVRASIYPRAALRGSW
jgi:ribokinase